MEAKLHEVFIKSYSTGGCQPSRWLPAWLSLAGSVGHADDPHALLGRENVRQPSRGKVLADPSFFAMIVQRSGSRRPAACR